MPSPALPTAADHELAAELATETGALLLAVRAELHGNGAGAATLKAEGDRRAHELLMSRLAERVPLDAILSEEGKAEQGRAGTARLGAARVWVVDPLDGTREFSEVPRVDWAVHVALVIDHQPVAGAVALPALGVTLSTASPPPLPPLPPAPPRVIVSRTRPPSVAYALVAALDGELVELGSAGAKVAAVIRGDADVYAHSGGQYEWDSAAPVAVARAAGLHTSRLDGQELAYNNADPYLPDLLVCHPALVDRVLDVTFLEG